MIDVKDIIKLEKELFGGKNPFAMFRGCVAYFYHDENEVSRISRGNNLSYIIFYYHVPQILATRSEVSSSNTEGNVSISRWYCYVKDR
jgi:hypothetical protein